MAFSASPDVNRHDEVNKPVAGEIKCTCSPCGCGGMAPPPPPPPPPAPSPPPPAKTPSTPSSCTPPPPPAPAQTWYVIGTPGVLYPLDPQYYPSAAPRSTSHAWHPLLFLGLILVLQFSRDMIHHHLHLISLIN
ncbi:hypothetical protein J5N97_004076 [Dioscorea zingiberensis]|uniref:Uncharacterized protein n=1 Tax=Dioscorea zingiberensis TaxID=325984 RepID=A0A9D5D7Y5_9LILI|nr:hypothetical protein J5N97_004076 [Dioscorea zingiberensis]